MTLEKILHMIGGGGETSYAKNSSLQECAIWNAKRIIEHEVANFNLEASSGRFAMAELGCSSGPNALLAFSWILNTLKERSHNLQMMLFLNDLPSNDFNTLFQYLPTFYEGVKGAYEEEQLMMQTYVAAVPGSFFERLFPDNSIHFIHASYSVHWLAQVPKDLKNKGNIYMSKSSPQGVFKSYLEEFQKDFMLFLKARSKEMVPGGCMVLTLLGRRSPDPSSDECCQPFKLFSDALFDMVSEGLVNEAKADSFDIPIYIPTLLELRAVVEAEGCFDIGGEEIFEMNWDAMEDADHLYNDRSLSGIRASKILRAAFEPMLLTHFGEDLPLDDLFLRFANNVCNYTGKKKKFINLLVTLKRKY
ncbi:Salicylate O-methyltransferase [Acorus calamus]|uniref:Salicylate O-methyltransferase n=1 Tax=Acorus calamus TaxID=4465 RepID=A0AAV9D8T4_ACOCL|nr:Salicylate O-methyltransferase [Acorus calamus]